MNGQLLFEHTLLGAAPLILCLGALLILMLEVFVKGKWPVEFVAAASILAGLVGLLLQSNAYIPGRVIFSGFLYADPYAFFFHVLILLGSLLALMLGAQKLRREGIEARAEYYALFLMSSAGAMWLAASAELIMLFLSLEIMSMALYCLCGSALANKKSAEAALKYFFLGSFSSAFLLYGIAMIYGLTGSTAIAEIGVRIASVDPLLLYLSVGLILVGLVFKIGAVPFHFWAPDVYEGAPTPVTAYMACVIKASAVAVALRVMHTAFGPIFEVWSGAIWTMALLTMVLGNLIALKQENIKRMLAYSSVAHAGYILLAFLAPSRQFGGGAAALYYLVAYTVMTMGAFGVVLAVGSENSNFKNPDHISRFRGLSSSRPFLAFVMTIFLLSLAGIPPGMAGLLGKFYVFSAVVKAGYVGIAVAGVLCSAVSCYYYLRVIVAMYFLEPAEQGGELMRSEVDLGLKGALSLCALAVVWFGIFPAGLFQIATEVMAAF